MSSFTPSPADLGSIKIDSINGYNGQKCNFINDNVIVYGCGSSIKFFDTETQKTQTFRPECLKEEDNTNGICLVTASSAINKFAYSDTQLSPTIYIHNYKDFTNACRLTDGAKIEYLAIEISNGEAVLALSSLPTMEIIVWNWMTGDKITKIELNSSLIPESISFSPINWRQIAVAYNEEVTFLNIEQFNKERIKTTKSRFHLPFFNTEPEKKIFSEFKDEFTYPVNAITNLDEEKGEVIDLILDKRKRHTFSALAWTTDSNDIIVVTKSNCIFKFILDSRTVKQIFETEAFDENALYTKLTNQFQICGLKLHRKGLLAACTDGIIRVLCGSELTDQKGNFSNIQVMYAFNLPSENLRNMSFNQKHTQLAVASDNGIFSIDCPVLFQRERFPDFFPQNEVGRHVVNCNMGRTLGVAPINPYGQNYVVIKSDQTIQIWSVKHNELVDRLDFDMQFTAIASHPQMPIVVLSTDEGQLVFIDYSNERQPNILEICRVHESSISFLKFNSSGTLLFCICADNKILIIDTRLNDQVEKILLKSDQRLTTNHLNNDHFEKGFHILGYIDFEGEPVCLDVLDIQMDKEIQTRVAIAIHDPVSWDIIKKVVEEVLPFSASPVASLAKSGKTENVNDTFDQNLLMSGIQTNVSIKWLDYKNTERDVEYVKESAVDTVKLACKVIAFDFSIAMMNKEEDPRNAYNSIKLDLKDEFIKRTTAYSYYLFKDFVLTGYNNLVASTDRLLTLFSIPDYDPMKKPVSTKFSYLDFVSIVGTHDFGFSSLARSLNNQFVASAGFDGSVTIRKTGDMKSYVESRVAHYSNGGVESIVFKADGTSLIAVGHDNSIVNLTWNCSFEPTCKLIKTPILSGDYDRSALNTFASSFGPDISISPSWFELKEKEFFIEQDKEYLPIKKGIINGLDDIRNKLKGLMTENEDQDDLAKLKKHEFYLDLDELDQLHKETDQQIATIKETTEFEDLARLYVRETIKKECWDKMAVKGRGIEAFNSNLLVENYGLKERTREETLMLERVQMIRKIEIDAQKVRNELCYDLMKKDNITDLVDNHDDENKEGTEVVANAKDQVPSNYLSPNLAQLAFKGSIGSLFGGDSHFKYSQFDLFTIEQKWCQIILIQDSIYRIKINFNSEFDQIMQRKNQEISKIKEKNQRLKQIYIDLDENKTVVVPKFGDAEKPEILFDVDDDEISIEKYLTPEQRKIEEEKENEIIRKRELEKLDNWRERGLMEMMGGVLQIRREDELKKNIPRPSFSMDKPKEEWTLEEVKLFAAFEQKCKDLEDEREKLRKHLNTEIIKINEQILECYQNFDNQLLNLHLRKVKTQQALYQEELKIVRLFNSIILDTELENNEIQLSTKLDKAKEQKKQLTQEIMQIKKNIVTFKEEYEIQAAEDKAQDKAFMREFSDVYPMSTREQLLKMFKKRAKQRMVPNKTISNPQNVFIPEYGVDNPFSDRPTTAQQIILYDTDTEIYLAELDDVENSPGIDNYIWERFVQHRRDKITMENNLKIKGLSLTEMNQYYQKRVEEEEKLKRQIEEMTKDLVEFQETRLRASHNLQVQLLMKQGQVEINPGFSVHNFSDCLLIKRDVVENLNKVIQHHGSQKITIMVDCKDYKKGIRQLEWEHRKMKMSIEDYIQRQRDITYLKLTREIQQYLDNPDYDANKQKEISVLEQTLAYKAKQQDKIYSKKAKMLKDINKSSVKVANVNHKFDDKLRDTNVVLHDRKHIMEEISGKNIDSVREEKFQQIIQRRKLVDLAKAQAQEVAFLRSEVERLRMKTFPALVQIEF